MVGGFSDLSRHPKMPFHGGKGKFKLLKIEQGDGHCLGFVWKSKGIICINMNCELQGRKSWESIKQMGSKGQDGVCNSCNEAGLVGDCVHYS